MNSEIMTGLTAAPVSVPVRSSMYGPFSFFFCFCFSRPVLSPLTRARPCGRKYSSSRLTCLILFLSSLIPANSFVFSALQDEPRIFVESEDEPDRVLLETKITKEDGYQKQQGSVLVPSIFDMDRELN